MAKRYRAFWSNRIKFLFAYDENCPELFHIYARHLTTPYIAMQTWEEGTREVWNIEYSRYETSSDNYTVYWFWLKANKEVLVISCFKR